MPADPAALLSGLKPLLKALDRDLLNRAKDPGVAAGLRASWERQKADGRTGADLKLWTRRRAAQVSIAWVLSVVFMRTLEDRGFLARRRIAGPGAEDSERQFVSLFPFLNSRDYLLALFRELAGLPGAADLFDARHNPVWVLAPSAGQCRALLDFFRRTDAEGELTFRFDGQDTRFLGDLYQDLSEDVRKRYALLQTPEFVEQFILEQTLDPAVQAFGLDDVRLIDPTCGSGHFLLGAFHRLLDAWQGQAPGEDRKVLAQRALSQVYGCDLNPYAVAIARFRLTLEFLQVAGINKLEQAPRLPLNLCVADSLLHGVAGQTLRLSETLDAEGQAAWGDQLFALEDEAEALRILEQRYHAVVGNPPYITEKDARKRQKYRDLYVAARKEFALAAPFTERFFGLAVPSGFVGMINANSFTKRDFGKALIEEVLPRVDVTKLVDTSGAYIPGHGTPTLLLFGQNRRPSEGDVTAVLGKRGEAEEPAVPANAPVWTEIVEHHDEVGFNGRYVSTEPTPRKALGLHPWVLAGGGARALHQLLNQKSTCTLQSMTDLIGFGAVTREDQVFVLAPASGRRWEIPDPCRKVYVGGQLIRDWSVNSDTEIVFPYKRQGTRESSDLGRYFQVLWCYRTQLWLRRGKGFKTKKEAGGEFYEFSMYYPDRHYAPYKIAFAFVATHNHFVLDRGGKVFKQSAPIIKLKDHYDEDDHLALLGLLNSSVACFWMKMVFYDKGSSSGGTIRRESWEPFFEFDGTKLKQFPVADAPGVREYAVRLDKLASTRQADSPGAVLLKGDWSDSTALRASLSARRGRDRERLEQMVGLQEELDWFCYKVYGLGPDIDVLGAEVAPRLIPGHRPFEISMALEGEPTDWFSRHGWQPAVEIPASYPDDYRSIVRRRLQLTPKTKALSLVEQPNFKRRWYRPDHEAEEHEALLPYLLDCLETLLRTQPQSTVTSARQLAAELQRDPRAMAVAEVYTGESAPDLERLITDLVAAEGVPYLAALRYADTGLEKHEEWKKTWELQRREDAGETVGTIPVPPKYATKDFRRGTYWTHRGKLDVPKERFVLYPGAETDNDASPWLGWAGWDHLQRATALSGLYQRGKTEEGWEPDKLLPLLAGLHELVPWLCQWHNEPDPAFGGQRLGDFFRDFVAGEAHASGWSTADLEAWRPAAKARGCKGGKKKGGGRKPKLTSDALLAAFEGADGADRAQADLEKDLGVSSATVGKVAKTCVEAGQLIQTSGRPKRYRLA